MTDYLLIWAVSFDQTQAAAPLIERLDDQTRGRVVLALAAIVMLGLLLITLTYLTFRIMRRRFQDTERIIQRQRNGNNEHDWASKPLNR